jgi:hypothetical protein
MTSNKLKRRHAADIATNKQAPHYWWFWAWLVQITTKKTRNGKPASTGEVWENLILVKAADADEAYQKAIFVGKSGEGDCAGTLRIDGSPAYATFLGVSDMGLVHDGIEDGTEILFRQKRERRSKAQSRVKGRRTLVARAAKELAPYKSIC